MNGAGIDDDKQKVDEISRDTLISLLRRKDRDLQTEKMKKEKAVRFNRILMEDRASFMRFCTEILSDSGDIFEEAAAQEIPVNLEALLRRLTKWKRSLEGVKEDRRVFKQFVELAFPGDEAIEELFKGGALSSDAFDILQRRWVALEELHSQSMASISAMAREQVSSKSRETQEAVTAKQELEKRIDELKREINKMAKEKAQILARRLQGGASEDVVEEVEHPLQDEFRQAVEAAEQKEQKAVEAARKAEERERQMSSQLEEQETQTQKLREERDRLREEISRHREQARQMVAEKDDVLGRLKDRLTQLEEELGSNSFIERAAEQQAGRDAEVRAQQREKQQIMSSLNEIQRLLSLSYSQERVLKERIRELEHSQDRVTVAGDYLKHVVVKYVEYTQRGDMKAQTLIPVLERLLSLGPEERKAIERPAIPQPLAYINQAVGESVVWLRGDPSDAPPARGSMPDMIHPAFQEQALPEELPA